MSSSEKKIVKVSPRLAKFIGAKATREKRMQAASLQAEFTLTDTLLILCYLSRDTDGEIASMARKNLIPAARNWYSRPDRPELAEPIHEIVMRVIERVGTGVDANAAEEASEQVRGNIGLLGLGEIIQAIDHNNRTVNIQLVQDGQTSTVFTENGKVVGALMGEEDGLEALYKAFGWVDADFTYLHGPPEGFSNRIKVNTLNLVMDALEYAPEDDPFDKAESNDWTVTGNLAVMNIFEIAEIFEMNSKQAVCQLVRDEGEGTLYFNSGRIINASFNDLSGMDAACQLLAWPSARFKVLRGGQGIEEVIHAGMQNLILEAMRLLDEGETVTDKIADELAKINELFDGADLVSLPVLDRVRLVFGENEQVREALEIDNHPLVRKAIRVKISKTVHKYLSPTTDHQTRIKAAKGLAPLSTTEKLVLLSYLSHDESEEIKEIAKQTLKEIDMPTYRKGFASGLHPAVIDFLVRETIKDESLIRVACASEAIMEETALYILDHWKEEETLKVLVENTALLERSAPVSAKLYETLDESSSLRNRIEYFEEGLLKGDGAIKAEGTLSMCGPAGLIRAFESASRSGTVKLESEGIEGLLSIKSGRLIGASWDKLKGRDALEGILSAGDLRFRWVKRTHFHEANLEASQVEAFMNQPGAGPLELDERESGIRLLSGDLEAMDLYEILTALEGTHIPVRISVKCEEGSGEIHRDKMHVLNATASGKSDPNKAMAAMLSWSGTKFIARYAYEDFPKVMAKNVGDFFSDCLREMADELKDVARPGELPEWELSEEENKGLYNRILHMGVADKIKLAFDGNKEAREILVRDPIKLVSVAAVRSPKIQESEIETISKSRSVCEDVLRQIAATKEWMKSYTIKLNLCNNSKTPLPITMKLVNHLREPDLRKLAKSKNIPSALATHARRLAETKGPA